MILSNPNAGAALSLVLVSRDDRQAFDDNLGAEKVSENCAEEHRSSHLRVCEPYFDGDISLIRPTNDTASSRSTNSNRRAPVSEHKTNALNNWCKFSEEAPADRPAVWWNPLPCALRAAANAPSVDDGQPAPAGTPCLPILAAASSGSETAGPGPVPQRQC